MHRSSTLLAGTAGCALLAWAMAMAGEAGGNGAIRLVSDKENVVASELIGTWVRDAALSEHLGGRSDHLGKGPIAFRRSKAAEERILRQLAELAKGLAARRDDAEAVQALNEIRRVYLAGEVAWSGKQWDFALIAHHGNPYLFLHDRKDNWEGEILMLARDHDGDNDLLLLGGDFNSQSFGAYKRAPTKASAATK